VLFTPAETLKAGGICPVCGHGLTVGVLSRVEELADRPEGFVPEGAIPARHLVPLQEIISEVMAVGPNSVRVTKEYKRLTAEGGGEFSTLLDLPEEDLIRLAGEETGRAVMKVRRGELNISPGFDGQFGKVRILSRDAEIRPTKPSQINLF